MTGAGARGRTVVVVGGGLSGLASAHRLAEAGYEVVVLERAGGVGGLARTEQKGHYLVDIGADLINGSFTHYLGLAREVGLEECIVSASPAADILRGGRAITVDRTRPLSLARSPILSARGKASAAAGLARLYPTMRKIDPYALTGTADDYGTAREFCDRYFDDEVTEWVIDPIVRAFAGTGIDGTSGLLVLSALAVGTKPAFGITGGMSALPNALARTVDVRCGIEVTSIDDTDEGVHVTYRGPSGPGEIDADLCVLAVSYHDARSMWPVLEDTAGEFGRKLRDVPLMSISLGYDVPSPTRSYAVLVPTRESSDALLVMMQQNKAPDRAPAGHTLVSLFTEARATTRLMNRSDDELMDWAAEFVESYYPGLRGRRDMSSVHRWPRTGYLPFPGYWQGIKEVRAGLPAGHVHTTSALFGSGGVERAVLGGERTARRIAKAA
ncbi:FAD-dependent oxidoreductase [Actinomycetospora sp. TBRC 11914]|uniref:protoporphyrinogen/coproporphyrinogen oxidase n=1 Tax=Actinomycetospora sp. TBRC 11914 TaxID=2729387 RepID=UPI00145CE05B|nr:FAD-dependent oxidoreductase [Actinomycetospora sp. TBRC 11914]NMO91659.1 NAD(P)-binding protein [Actinomycetospora sp. TBRC 11914]